MSFAGCTVHFLQIHSVFHRSTLLVYVPDLTHLNSAQWCVSAGVGPLDLEMRQERLNSCLLAQLRFEITLNFLPRWKIPFGRTIP